MKKNLLFFILVEFMLLGSWYTTKEMKYWHFINICTLNQILKLY